MYYRKKIVLTDAERKVYQTAEVRADESTISVSVGVCPDEGAELAVFTAGKLTLCGKAPCSRTFSAFRGEEIHVAVLQGERVLATGSTEGSHNAYLFTREIEKTREKAKPSSSIESKPHTESTQTVQKPSEPCPQTEQSCDLELPSEQSDQKEEKSENPLDSFIPFEGKSNAPEFYCTIKQNLEEMLTCYPREERLSALIDESEWVKVERTDGFYAVGLIKNNGKPEYVCYGVPARLSDSPPDSLRAYCQWIPTDEEDNGYWTVFQDAKTGIALKNTTT